jgi:hypothetical protein
VESKQTDISGSPASKEKTMSYKQVMEPWGEVLDLGDLASLVATGPRRHPLERILVPTPDAQAVASRTTSALCRALGAGSASWKTAIGKRLISSDEADAASALGEIRAFGTLLAAGLDAQPVPNKKKPTPDFEVLWQQRARVSVEVQTRRLSDNELQAIASASAPQAGQPGWVAITERVVTPFGKPRRAEPGTPAAENVTANVVQKIAQTKLHSDQLKAGPTVLWLDFQEDMVGFATRTEAAVPVSASQGRWWSGALWFAAYGWKGAPLFEGACLGPWIGWNSVTMQHEGRFNQGCTPSLIVVSFEDGVVALEHPSPAHRVPRWFLVRLMRLTEFVFERSWLDWPTRTLQGRVGEQRAEIKSLARRVR